MTAPILLSGNLLSVEPGMIFWTLVTFLLLILLLGKMVWKPILNTLNEREKKIKEALEAAERAKKDAEAATARNEEIMKQARQEAQDIVVKARESAEKIAKTVKDKADEASKKMIDDAHREIEREKQGVVNELRQVVVTLAIQSAEKIIKANLDEKGNRKLIDEFISEIKDN